MRDYPVPFNPFNQSYWDIEPSNDGLYGFTDKPQEKNIFDAISQKNLEDLERHCTQNFKHFLPS
jgi:hypothetical protein